MIYGSRLAATSMLLVEHKKYFKNIFAVFLVEWEVQGIFAEELPFWVVCSLRKTVVLSKQKQDFWCQSILKG